MKLRQNFTCPLELTHDLIKGKWKPILLWVLGKGTPLQPVELEKAISGIGQKMLLQQLAELLDAHMVQKKVYVGYPLKTEYSLTLRGSKILQAIVIMQEVGSEIMLENIGNDKSP